MRKQCSSLALWIVVSWLLLAAALPAIADDSTAQPAQDPSRVKWHAQFGAREPADETPEPPVLVEPTPTLWRLENKLPAPRAEFDPEAPVVDVAAAAAGTPMAPGDLLPTIDVQITQEITDKANELGTPQAMYEFVRNECEFQAYYGSQKGSVETLRQRAGNDYDLASLLIALLRAKNYPARYAEGQVEMTVDQAKGWLAVDDPEVAGSILTTKGLEGVTVSSGSTVVAIRARRIWVEAWVRRGYGSPTWVPLDPSFKLTDVRPGLDIPEEMGLDAQAFIDEYYDPTDPSVTLPRAETPLELLEQELTGYLATSHPDMTLGDVMRTHELVAESLGILPASLPYTVRSRGGAFSEIPAARRYQVRFHLHDGATTLINHTVDLPTIATRRVTIDYVGATSGDQAIIDSRGGIYQTPPYLVNLKPVLRVDGQDVAVGATGVGMGRTHESDIYFLAPTNASGLPQNVVPAIYNTITTGASQTIGFAIEGVSEQLLNPPPADDTEGLASLRQDIAMDYLARCSDSDHQLARLMRDFVTTDVADAIVENVVNVTYDIFGTPQTFVWKGLRVDADRSVLGVWPVDRYQGGDPEPRDFMVLTGPQGSLLESRVYEDAFGQDSVSTVKILELASNAGITIYKRWASLPLPANTQSSSVRQSLTNAIQNGHVVTFPAAPMTIGTPATGQWTGTGWIDMEPATGAAGYIISGNNNGGSTVETWPPEFVDLSDGDKRVRRVEIEITRPADDSPDGNAIFTRDHEEHLVFQYVLHVTYDDNSTRTLPATGTYKRTTRNTTRTFSPGNYTFTVWVGREIWWIFTSTIAEAERKVSIVGVLIRGPDRWWTPFTCGSDPEKFLPILPAGSTSQIDLQACIFPSRDPSGADLPLSYSWTGAPLIRYLTPSNRITRLEPHNTTPSTTPEDQTVELLVGLPGGKVARGRTEFVFTLGSADEDHKMTVFKLALKHVSFSGAKHHTVTKDDGSGDYTAPHWQDNSSPLDGDADDVGDKKYPICFTRNTKMRVSAKWRLEPGGLPLDITMKGDGPGNLDFPETAATVSGTDLLLSDVECSNPFVNQIDFFDPMSITWRFSLDDGSTWYTTTTSANQTYVTLGDPVTMVYHTLAHLGCKNADGETTAAGCTAKIWGEFTDRNVRRVDGVQLTYYASYTCGNLTTASLLANGDGQCGAWAKLFIDMRKVQGIDDIDEYVIFEPIADDGFVVKNWTFNGAGTSGHPTHPYLNIFESDATLIGATSYNWTFAEVNDAPGIPGQGNANPASLFNNHQVVISGQYYDPSYGIQHASLQSIDDTIDGFYIAGTYPVDEPAVSMDLNGDGDETDLNVIVNVILFRKNPPGLNILRNMVFTDY